MRACGRCSFSSEHAALREVGVVLGQRAQLPLYTARLAASTGVVGRRRRRRGRRHRLLTQTHTTRHDTIRDAVVRSKADISQLNLPHSGVSATAAATIAQTSSPARCHQIRAASGESLCARDIVYRIVHVFEVSK